MYKSKPKAVLYYNPMYDQQDLYIKISDDQMVTALKVETVKRDLGAKEPLLTGNDAIEFVQAIMDAGWKAGLKPLGYEDASRELTATKFHLEDMRTLAKVKKQDAG